MIHMTGVYPSSLPLLLPCVTYKTLTSSAAYTALSALPTLLCLQCSAYTALPTLPCTALPTLPTVPFYPLPPCPHSTALRPPVLQMWGLPRVEAQGSPAARSWQLGQCGAGRGE
jgi:hypothetical protein